MAAAAAARRRQRRHRTASAERTGPPHWLQRREQSFHPLDDAVDALRWSDVAATHGHRMHPGAQWEIISTDQPDLPLKSGRGFPGEPELGHLHHRALAALCHILAPHTTTAQRC